METTRQSYRDGTNRPSRTNLYLRDDELIWLGTALSKADSSDAPEEFLPRMRDLATKAEICKMKHLLFTLRQDIAEGKKYIESEKRRFPPMHEGSVEIKTRGSSAAESSARCIPGRKCPYGSAEVVP